MEDARLAAEAAARASYGRLVAWLAARSCDVAAAEDALAEAFARALESWPRAGVPERPEAWLLTVARRGLLDGSRHGRVRTGALATLALLAEERGERTTEPIPDERLKLLFVCAHPAIEPAMRAPLMLQVVLGLDAARIASAFLVAPATMGQRLVRAKARIKEAGLAFEVPGADELAARLDPVLEAIYAAYGSGWDDNGADPRRRGLAQEALWLASVVVALLPAEPEGRGLLALMLHCESRRNARRAADRSYVPLALQDTALWDLALAQEAERQLATAARAGRVGRFQLEAAIQSAHAERAMTGAVSWPAIAALHDALVAQAPTVGVLVARAAAIAAAGQPGQGLAYLDELPAGTVAAYQPYWAVRAHLLAGLGRAQEAQVAYDRALGLTEDPAVRAFLLERRAATARLGQ